jgi:hypothetical protein
MRKLRLVRPIVLDLFLQQYLPERRSLYKKMPVAQETMPRVSREANIMALTMPVPTA